MCYWRRLSKRSVDNSDFEYTEAASNSSSGNHLQKEQQQQALVSDSLSLFKALQVRHEPIEPEKARQRAQRLQEIYAEDDEAQLVCYRHAEVLVFMTTIGSLLLLVVSITLTCCWRLRKLTKLRADGSTAEVKERTRRQTRDKERQQLDSNHHSLLTAQGPLAATFLPDGSFTCDYDQFSGQFTPKQQVSPTTQSTITTASPFDSLLRTIGGPSLMSAAGSLSSSSILSLASHKDHHSPRLPMSTGNHSGANFAGHSQAHLVGPCLKNEPKLSNELNKNRSPIMINNQTHTLRNQHCMGGKLNGAKSNSAKANANGALFLFEGS